MISGDKMLVPAELKGMSRDLYIFGIFFRQGTTVTSFIIIGYVWQILRRGGLFGPPTWATPKRPILNRVKY